MLHEKSYDVVVVGSGPAGIGAAIAASRGGANTLIIEKESTLGGMMTGGLVTGFHGMRSHMGFQEKGKGSYIPVAKHTPILTKGIAMELCNRLVQEGAADAEIDDPPMRTEYDPQVMIPLLFKMMEENKVNVLLDSFVFGVGMDGNKIDYVRVANKSGETHIYAKEFIDCSADGDVAAWSGAPYIQGGEDGRCMPVTIYSIIGNVDIDKFFQYFFDNPDDMHIGTPDGWYKLYREGRPLNLIGLRQLIQKAAKNGDYPNLLNQTTSLPYPIMDIQTSLLPKGMVKIQADMAYGIDITDADDLTKAEMEIRTVQIPGIYRFLKKYAPGFEKAILMETASLIGTRESRRIVGQYTLTGEDVMANREFHHSIGRCGRAMNVHSSGGGAQDKPRGGQQWIEQPLPTGFGIPYEILVPQKVENLLVGGRCVSADRNALGSLRGEPTCMVTGEAAGEAAALCIKSGCSPKDIDVKELQKVLISHNVII
jgi:hypothetical protein